MIVDSLSDGARITQLLASEVTGHKGTFPVPSTVDSNPDMEPADDGAFAYAVAANGERVAEVYIQPDCTHVEPLAHPDATAETASEAGLCTRPKAVYPLRTLMFIGDGVQVRRTLPAFRALVAALGAGEREKDEG